MPKIRIRPLRSVGLDDRTVVEGDEVEVDKDAAASLIDEGVAELVKPTKSSETKAAS